MTQDDTHAVPARHPLRRDSSDRLLLGVCSGIARSLDVPPLAVRIGAVVLAALAFPLVLAAYVIVAAIVPRDDGRVLLGGVPGDRRETLIGWSLVAFVLIWFAGAQFRLEDLVWPALSSFGIFAAAVAALALLALQQRRATQPAAAAATATPPPPPSAEPEPASAAPGDDAPTGEAPTVKQPAVPPPPPPPPPPRGVSLGTIGAAVLLIGGAVAFLLVAVGAIDPDATGVAVALGVAAALFGAGAIAGAVLRRRGVFVLLALGTLLAAASAGVGLLSQELDDGVGWRTVQPASAADIPSEYRLGVGDLDVDLRDTALPAGATTVSARVRVGELTVLVPRGVRVESIGPTVVDGIDRVNRALPKPEPKPAGKRKRKQQAQKATAPAKTIRIDADVREGDADVVAGGP